MTNNLYQNIQALGNRMVTNLNAMGVSAEFADGGLTLADKILEINNNDRIILSADKSIAQTSNSILLTALLIKNGKTVSGENVIFYNVDGAFHPTSDTFTVDSDEWTLSID